MTVTTGKLEDGADDVQPAEKMALLNNAPVNDVLANRIRQDQIRLRKKDPEKDPEKIQTEFAGSFWVGSTIEGFCGKSGSGSDADFSFFNLSEFKLRKINVQLVLHATTVHETTS